MIDYINSAVQTPPPYVPPADQVAGPLPHLIFRLSVFQSTATTFLDLSVDTIYDSSRRKVQAAISAKLSAVEAAAIHNDLLALGNSGKVVAARFVDRWQRGAQAWLHASRQDDGKSSRIRSSASLSAPSLLFASSRMRLPIHLALSVR